MEKETNFNSIIICFLPLIVIIPIGKDIILNIHFGGINTVINFFSSAINPSLNSQVISNCINGIQITLAIASLSWVISMFNGLLLGIISSKKISKLFNIYGIITNSIQFLLSIPRAVHEIVWGLLLLQLFGITPFVAIFAIVIPYSALMGKVFADQIDSMYDADAWALKKSGAGSFEIFITAILPKLIPLIITYGGYRLECAIRGAILLGVFGMGGIGTELELSFRSLQFKEAWTSLWILAIVILSLEKYIAFVRKLVKNNRFTTRHSIFIIIIISLFILYSIFKLNNLDVNQPFHSLHLSMPDINEIIHSFTSIKLIKLILETLNITILAAGLAIGMPPLILTIFPTKIGNQIAGGFWLFCRLIPTPLLALLFSLCIKPTLGLAALVLGISNMGVMGKVLKESIDSREDSISTAIKGLGTNNSVAWIYGKLSLESRSYIAYSCYRIDVILRETVMVGGIGGIGLGWQLQESLSSFAWAEVFIIVISFMGLTIFGESISQRLKLYLGSN